MPKYLLEVEYTLDGVRAVLAKGGSARRAAAATAAKSVGGKLESFYFAFGGTDVYAVADLPDNPPFKFLPLKIHDRYFLSLLHGSTSGLRIANAIFYIQIKSPVMPFRS